MTISVLVADDHPIIRAGIVSMLKDTEMKVVAEAATGNQAIELAVKHHPDVVLLDIRMPETDGLEALERIVDRSPRTKVVLCEVHPTSVSTSDARTTIRVVISPLSLHPLQVASRSGRSTRRRS